MNRSAAEPIQLNDQAAFTVVRPTKEKAQEVETVAESVNQEEMVAVTQPRDSAGVQSFQLKEQAAMIQPEDSSVVQSIQQKEQMAVTQLKGSTEIKPDEKNQAAATLHPKGSLVVKPIQPMDQQAVIQPSGSLVVKPSLTKDQDAMIQPRDSSDNLDKTYQHRAKVAETRPDILPSLINEELKIEDGKNTASADDSTKDTSISEAGFSLPIGERFAVVSSCVEAADRIWVTPMHAVDVLDRLSHKLEELTKEGNFAFLHLLVIRNFENLCKLQCCVSGNRDPVPF
jgi:hypothetical protein